MTIQSKYDGVCRTCGGVFHAGDPIEWKKGEGSRHSVCPATPEKPPRKVSWKKQTEDGPFLLLVRDPDGAASLEGEEATGDDQGGQDVDQDAR